MVKVVIIKQLYDSSLLDKTIPALMLQYHLPKRSREMMLWLGWLVSHDPRSPPGVDVLEGGKLNSNDALGHTYDPLQSSMKAVQFPNQQVMLPPVKGGITLLLYFSLVFKDLYFT